MASVPNVAEAGAVLGTMATSIIKNRRRSQAIGPKLPTIVT